MRELGLPTKERESGEIPTGARDPFGIVGTTQSDVYRIEKVVAHGGFAVIYKAHHVRFRSPVALKCLKIPTNLTAEERTAFFERFRAEGEVMFRLSSSIPEIVRPMAVEAFRLDDGRLVPFIALEWLDGETLKEVIVRRLTAGKPPLSLRKAVELLTPVARALARAHQFPTPEGTLAILHCDLKPDNIFVSEVDGGKMLKIFDFGIAKVRSAATRQAGGATSVDRSSSMFTPAYAAPEQWAPDQFGQTGAWTDVYALALVLTELVTQKPAVDGPPAAMLAQALDPARRPTPKRLGLELPPALDAIFERALAVDPKKRTQSIEKLWGELEVALGMPPVLGPRRSRTSMSAMSAVLPPSWEDEEEEESAMPSQPSSPPNAPSDAPGGLSFDGDLDLAPAAPRGPSPVPAAPTLGTGLGTALPLPASPPLPGEDADESDGLGAAAFDLAADPARPAPPAGPPAPGPGTPSGGVPAAMGLPAGLGPFPGEASAEEAPPQGPSSKEKLQAAAQVAAQKAGQAATVAATTAAAAAKHVATKALEVDERHRISLEDPSTWVKPMLGPIIAFGVAVLISVGAVIVNKITLSNTNVTWISLPLLLAATGFAVYRWMKLQGRDP